MQDVEALVFSAISMKSWAQVSALCHQDNMAGPAAAMPSVNSVGQLPRSWRMSLYMPFHRNSRARSWTAC
ncbi:hypothetical protein EBN15_09960 [Xanthomonas cucurbitae]|nr:hypothetical protein EBN15_09960 [Xanthomonas cucurbitae]